MCDPDESIARYVQIEAKKSFSPTFSLGPVCDVVDLTADATMRVNDAAGFSPPRSASRRHRPVPAGGAAALPYHYWNRSARPLVLCQSWPAPRPPRMTPPPRPLSAPPP